MAILICVFTYYLMCLSSKKVGTVQEKDKEVYLSILPFYCYFFSCKSSREEKTVSTSGRKKQVWKYLKSALAFALEGKKAYVFEREYWCGVV